jgi:leucyl/phenylalanyl-tRNA--protein transferase
VHLKRDGGEGKTIPWDQRDLLGLTRICKACPQFAKHVRVHDPLISDSIDPELLMLAYRGGIFPMADSRDDPEIFWVEPQRRAILPLENFRCSRSLARTLRRGRFRVTCNQAFAEVMAECAAPRRKTNDAAQWEASDESWISDKIISSYIRLHRLGHAHSIECWQPGSAGEWQLVGGLYGVGFDRVFCGESMFSRVHDSSKVALAWLVAALRRAGVTLLDCQFMTPHLASLGAVELSQQHYLVMLKAAQASYVTGGLGDGFGEGVCLDEADGLGTGEAGLVLTLAAGFAALLADAAATGSSSSPGNFIAQSLTQTS